MSDAKAPGRTGARIGIFRRVAVERYMQPMESDTPEMLAAPASALFAAAVVLLCAACVLLFLP